ncbi:Zinc finger and BTB domain-containing protein 40 [Platysternon megacephalum]|uniref:Zinc finger and BTB domain-containing protein 40 n=1 Tax=Platysternon megacephalum TaxID=55544 RepID=A0A4D9EU33_9SAUR|nr:Zinc finger and BTB domain-containing protein 40 [Platysternon megacephalum]
MCRLPLRWLLGEPIPTASGLCATHNPPTAAERPPGAGSASGRGSDATTCIRTALLQALPRPASAGIRAALPQALPRPATACIRPALPQALPRPATACIRTALLQALPRPATMAKLCPGSLFSLIYM